MHILEHLDQNNLHHAYLIEGEREIILPELLGFVESLGIKTSGNPDFCVITLDSLKREDAKNLKSMGGQKGFSEGKKIFIVSANSFLLEAQNTLLKIFEEPIQNTHFFLILPDKNVLLPTLLSRLYLIKSKDNLEEEIKQVEKFISLSPKGRIDFLKEIMVEEEEDDSGVLSTDSVRSNMAKFLNALEVVIHNRFSQDIKNQTLKQVLFFEHLFKVRVYLRQPGSSVKSLIESVALAIPNL